MSDVRKIVVRDCYDCKYRVEHRYGLNGPYCHYSTITKIINSFAIPDFCKLPKDE